MKGLEGTISSDHDILIVGAGPAGCSVANFLKKDFRVLMVDSSNFPRRKPCGGLLTSESKTFIKKFDLPSSIISRPNYLDIEYVDWENNLDLVRLKGYLNVNREKFDAALLDSATKTVDFSPATKLSNVQVVDEGFNILLEQNDKKITIKSKYLVGADGARSAVRGLVSEKKVPHYVAVQQWMNNGHTTVDHFVYILCNQITDFYSWMIPKDDKIIIGAAFPVGFDANEKFGLLKKMIKEKMNLDIRTQKKEACLLTRPSSTNDLVLGDGNVFLVGEAAGFVSPSSGDGISFALRSGFNCAKAINSSDGAAFEEYHKLSEPLIKEIAEKLKKAQMLSDPEKRLKMLNRLG